MWEELLSFCLIFCLLFSFLTIVFWCICAKIDINNKKLKYIVSNIENLKKIQRNDKNIILVRTYRDNYDYEHGTIFHFNDGKKKKLE